jgi:AraC-like DNA-binding protein
VADLASSLGYQSEAAFSRAFKRFIGISPGAVRRNGGTQPSDAQLLVGTTADSS